MRLKKLELSGFKSFKNKTVITFDKGLTGLVGPNGCGKSNIVDAILWVTGEQSSKTLRGYSMESLIFNGSDGTSRASMAEVSLTLENDNGVFPSKYASFTELTLTRRIYRSGESEYLINNNFCRLKDIREVFMDSGVRAYAIIEQGEVNRVIMSSPKERRYIIEEAAGISKYKFRKDESLKKLKSAEENMQRLDDILGELESRLSNLEQQVKEARKYNELKEKEKELSIKKILAEYNDTETLLAQSDTRKVSLSGELDITQKELLEKELYLQDISSKKSNFLSEIKTFSIKLGAEKARYESLLSKKELLERELETSQKAHDKNNLKLDSIKNFISEADIRILELSKQKENLEKEYNELSSGDSFDNLDELREEKRDLEQSIQGYEQNIVKLQTSRARLQSDIENIIKQLETNNLRLNKLLNERDKLTDSVKGLEASFVVINDNVSNFKKRKDELELKITGIAEELDIRNSELVELVKETEVLSTELSQKNAELHFLETASFDSGISKDLIATADAVVTDLIVVPEELQDLLKTYVARWSKVLIVNGKTKLRNFIEQAKKENTVFGVLNIDYARPTRLTHGDYIFGEYAGSLTHILDLVSYKEEDRKLVETIFNNVFVVDTWEKAVEINKVAKGNDYVLIARTGEIVYPDGVFFVGSSTTTNYYINRTKRIEFIKSEQAKLTERLSSLEQKRQSILEKIEYLAREQERFKEVLNGIGIEFATSGSSLEALNSRINDQKTRISELNFDIEQINYENESLANDKAEKEQELAEIGTKIDGDGTILQEEKEKYRELSAVIDRLSSEQFSLDSKLELLSEKLNTVNFELDAIANEKDLKQEDLVQLGTEQGILNENIASIKQELTILYKELERGNADFGEQKLKELEKNVSSIELTELELSKEMNELKQRLSKIELDIGILEKEKGTALKKLEVLKQSLWEKYEFKLDELKTLKVEATLIDLDKQLKKVQKTLNNFGAVNLLAIDEYEELRERFEFLAKQRDDIKHSKDNLEHIVKKMDLTSKERFKEAFNSINKNFRAFFPVLFGGGDGELVLSDPDNLLETGFDIIAKLPGKARQSLSLFSGGEKALTAISLILAVFATKPSPFCVLDEVDAPLDEANIVRFNRALKAMADSSQFIVVTHSKTTMSFLDAIYGITMQKKGVSKVFHVNLEDVKEQYLGLDDNLNL